MTNVKCVDLDVDNKAQYVAELEYQLYRKFGDAVPDTYDRTYPWSLLSLIESDSIDTYRMVYVNGVFWGACGGMIREHRGEKVYQCGFRGFSNHQANDHGMGIGSKSLMYTHCISVQIERARSLKCSAVIMSFNQHNYKLFTVVYKYHLPKVFGAHGFVPSTQPVMFNGVPQWLLTMSLK